MLRSRLCESRGPVAEQQETQDGKKEDAGAGAMTGLVGQLPLISSSSSPRCLVEVYSSSQQSRYLQSSLAQYERE